MQQTETYKLNLIETGDTFSPQPINENMEAIEAVLSTQMLKASCGTYIGTGTSGSSAPTVLTFEFEPKVLMIWSGTTSYRLVGIRGQNLAVYYTERFSTLPTTWSGNTVSWYASVYSGDATGPQLNSSNTTYQYLALG